PAQRTALGKLAICEKVRCHVQLPSHNGWENKFTWLVHLHLSNEESLMNESIVLVASEPNDAPAGRLVEMWVRNALMSWCTRFPGRRMLHDESMRLLAWDMVGTSLAYADWDALVSVLLGEATGCENVFTMTLYRCILNHTPFLQYV